tara:strand:+ start:330 stop:635 length:306 start_codon:yes stop_codon:yes gene_type:complete
MVYDIDTDIENASREAHKILYGSEIVGARYLSKEEANDLGWYKSGLVLWLKTKEGNTIQIIVQQDDEGNDSGVLGYQIWEDYLDDKKRKKIKDDTFYNIHI